MSDDPDKDILDELGTRLEGARNDHIDPSKVKNNHGLQNGNALGLAFRVGVELISAVAVGTAIGWGLDYWLDTRPWFMLVFIIVGGCDGGEVEDVVASFPDKVTAPSTTSRLRDPSPYFDSN